MKIIFIGCSVLALATGIYALNNIGTETTHEAIETLTACESIGWWDNNGNCVHDDSYNYFCKEDTWYELTDCLMK